MTQPTTIFDFVYLQIFAFAFVFVYLCICRALPGFEREEERDPSHKTPRPSHLDISSAISLYCILLIVHRPCLHKLCYIVKFRL